jgi:hypothetical protein
MSYNLMHQGIKIINILSNCINVLDMKKSLYQLIVLFPLKTSTDSRENSCQGVCLRTVSIDWSQKAADPLKCIDAIFTQSSLGVAKKHQSMMHIWLSTS